MSQSYDQLDIHHVGQKTVMKKFIPDYDPKTAPAILVPRIGHTRGENVLDRNIFGHANPRDVIARDIKELRRVYPDIPNNQLQALIDLNKKTYLQLNK